MKNALDEHVSAYEGQSLYDFDNDILLKWYPKRIVALNPEAKSLLELGLGHGFSTSIFSTTFPRHVVLDGSLAVIENFKKRYPDYRAEIIETFFENYKTDERFDVIVLGFILEHVDDPVSILNRFKQFVKPGGRIYAAVPNAEVLNRRLGHLAGLLPDMQELSRNDILLGHKRYYTVKTLAADVESAGYEIERMEGIYLKPLTTRQLISLNLDIRIIHSLCEVGIEYPELSCGILVQLK
ncbi:MAG: class I SAM-dependent methyltransferase [Cyclobacteriaceae bacterium]